MRVKSHGYSTHMCRLRLQKGHQGTTRRVKACRLFEYVFGWIEQRLFGGLPRACSHRAQS